MLVQQQTPVPAPPALQSPLQHSKTQWESTRSARKQTSATPKPFTLRPATNADASSIAQLGSSIFRSTFGFSMPSTDLETYLASAYAVSAISNDIQNPRMHIIVATSPSNTVIGFAQLTEGTTEPCLSDLTSNHIELQRLYVDAAYHGSGVGKALTQQMERLASQSGHSAMWLGIWEGNFVAQKVYEKMGFGKVGEHEFQMGKCIQIDWIMWKDIKV